MTHKTNRVHGMVLDSLGRVMLGSVHPIATSTLYVSGSSYMTGNEFVGGTIQTNQTIYLNSINGKIGVGLILLKPQSKQRIWK
jgi:hypothetical protein